MGKFFADLWFDITVFFNQILSSFAAFSVFDLIDILIVAYVIYKLIEFVRETRAKQVVKGIILLFVIWVFAQWFDLISIKWMLVKVLDYAIIAIAIIFQPEIRRALENMGRGGLISTILGRGNTVEQESTRRCIDAVCKAAGTMQENKVGALIVFERKTALGEVISTGTSVNADASVELISNVFYPKSPLHDGALIIRGDKLMAAGCILPLTSSDSLSKALGTRHRAAVGMSENSDSVVVVVSEETGNISLAMNGEITRDYTSITLREDLIKLLIDEPEQKYGRLAKIFKVKSKKYNREEKIEEKNKEEN